MAALPLTPSSADQSVDLIGQIFGSNWQHLLDGGASGGGGGATQTIIPNGGSLFGDMFLVANSIALAIAGLLIVYTVLVGAMSTAHEGESLGRRFHTLWAPVRSAFAIALLMPLAGGYSLLQASILYFASMGIGVADAVWEKGLVYISSSQGVIVSPPTSRVDDLTNGVLKSLVCQAYQNKQAVNFDQQTLITMNQTLTPTGPVISFDGTPGSGNPVAACGRITLKCVEPAGMVGQAMGSNPVSNNLIKPICEAQYAATLQLINLMEPVATAILKDETPTAGQIEDAVSKYNITLRQGIAQAVSTADTERATQIALFVAKARDEGWASAGSWYWTISRLNQQIASAASKLPIYSGISPDIGGGNMEPYLAAVDGYIQTHGSPVGSPNSQLAQTGAGEDDNPAMKVMLALGEEFRQMVDVGSTLSDGSDPVARMQSIGNYMIDAAGTAAIAVAAAQMAKKTDAALSPDKDKGWFGVGKLLNLISGTLSVLPILFLIMIGMLMLGMTLAYYLPSVPFILWTLGVVGYLVLLVESLVAAPLWAIGHAIPEGEGMAGQHGKQGYMLFLNVIARPALMVFGYFAAVLIMWGVAGWIGKGYQTFTAGLQADTFTGIFAILAMYAVLSGLIVAVAHMAFGMIHEVPDRVLRWIGGGGAQLGESGGEHKANQGFTAVGGVVNHGTEAMGRRAASPKPQNPENKPKPGGDQPGADTASTEQSLQTGEAKGNGAAPAATAAEGKAASNSKQSEGEAKQDYGGAAGAGADEAKHQPKDR